MTYHVGDSSDIESERAFVVYDGRTAYIVANVNVTSWQAYNEYGGESLYTDASGTMPHGKAWEVSFDRPFSEGHGAGRFPLHIHNGTTGGDFVTT